MFFKLDEAEFRALLHILIC